MRGTDSRWDPYEELGVDQSASLEEIKWAFRSKARESHPDKVCVFFPLSLSLSPSLSLSGLHSHRSLRYCNAHIFSLPASVSLCLSRTLSCLSVCLRVCVSVRLYMMTRERSSEE